jgi:hypothetical protein
MRSLCKLPLHEHQPLHLRFTWSSYDNEHVGLCAEFPSLSWLAPSPEKALSDIRKVVADAVEEMTASRESVPG